MNYYNQIKDILYGVAIGDALGLHVQFASREIIKETPVEDMEGYGVFSKPPGYFSDDSSLTFALSEALIDGYDLDIIAQNFVKWLDEGYWTPDGEAYDIGTTTFNSITNIKEGIKPTLSGETHERSNGNGSLMRISPLIFTIMDKPIEVRFQMIKEVSSITHRHTRSIIACFYYLEFLRYLLDNDLDLEKHEIYHKLQKEVPKFLNNYFKEEYDKKENEGNEKDLEFNLNQISYFDRLLKENIHELGEDEINSGGYVIDTIEASIWCLLTTDNYSEAVLKAVNLGGDTDTTAAVTGGLVGLLYGFDNIPEKWIEELARSRDIDDLASRFADSF